MRVDDYITGGDWMKAADLGNTTPTITISKVELIDFPEQNGQAQPSKLCIHPSDPAVKAVILNKTNSRACAAAWGNESDAWIGKQCLLSVRQTQMGPGIGVTPLQQQAAPVNPGVAGPTSTDVPFNDAIPY